ncbi:MAG: hypothetical protein SFU99_20485 [Saprospiraceae bacterium]|nr:hypothetical protein [Saprospiraceae bacterium]
MIKELGDEIATGVAFVGFVIASVFRAGYSGMVDSCNMTDKTRF